MKLRFVQVLLLGASLLPGLSALAEEAQTPDPDAPKKIYKQKQPDGTVIYTDEPGPGAEEVRVQQLPTYEAPRTPSFTPYQPPRETQSPGRSYERFAISSPGNDEAIRDNTGNITVSVSLSPVLDAGHQIEYLLDGVLVETTGATSIQLQNVDRGSHTITARVVDHRGAVLDESSVTVHLQRTSVLQPGRNQPAPPKPKATP